MTTHGMHSTRFYSIWNNMKNRCEQESSPNYSYYGGRGIKVCDRWQKFENFRDDLLKCYEEHVSKYGEKQTTLDRIEVDGDYTPENIRWATYKEQVLNTRVGKNNTSGHVGVSWHKLRNKWRARVTIDGKEKHLGLFDRIEDAVKAREEFIKERGFING